MTQEKEETREPESIEKTTEAQIAQFAALLGEETGHKFDCYIYRIMKDPDSGKTKKPFIKKYSGIEPDPAEIAEKYRGGTYLVQFIWYVKKEQRSRAYTLDVDEETFPPLPKPNNNPALIGINSGMSESMTLQLAMMQNISEVMKAAYSSGNNKPVQNADPLEMFAGIMTTMEEGFGRAMQIQSKIMERVFTKNMESRYGLLPDESSGSSAVSTEDIAGDTTIGKYAPIVKEIVEGLKSVIGLFGEVPKNVADKVKKDGRFQGLLKDEKALVVIGSALQKEFGMERANEIMNTFGVRIMVRRPPEVRKTPDIPGISAGNGARVHVPAQPGAITGKASNNGKKQPVRGKSTNYISRK